jgi:hypothetical protein
MRSVRLNRHLIEELERRGAAGLPGPQGADLLINNIIKKKYIIINIARKMD